MRHKGCFFGKMEEQSRDSDGMTTCKSTIEEIFFFLKHFLKKGVTRKFPGRSSTIGEIYL